MDDAVLIVRIAEVSLKLKFKCKMKIEWKDGIATREANANNGIFKFD